jgi:hypothetical protein
VTWITPVITQLLEEIVAKRFKRSLGTANFVFLRCISIGDDETATERVKIPSPPLPAGPAPEGNTIVKVPEVVLLAVTAVARIDVTLMA